ncbi:hypothetical protein CRYUN_Cryun18bG0047500 [Craigia yunnanensis]
MSSFPSQHLPFVLNSFVEPNTLNYPSSLLSKESSGDSETCFSSNFIDTCFQEMTGPYAQNYRAITLHEANLQVLFKVSVNPSAVAKQASYSNTIPMAMELERRGDHVLLTAELSALDNKRKKVDTKVESEINHEKQKNMFLAWTKLRTAG